MSGKPLTGQAAYNRHVLWLAATLLLILLAGCANDNPTRTAGFSGNSAGMPIAVEFQEFYQQNGGLRVFGYPLSEAFLEADGGRLIQYFQRLRLEYDRAGEQVIVTPLGRWALPEPAEPAPAQLAEVQSSGEEPENEFQVQGAFLEFYQAHGGPKLFGRPISTQVDEGDTRAQYFENARLDWQPEASLDYRIQVGRLGEAHYRQVGVFEDPGRSRPLDSAGLREADVSASFLAPILYAGDEQVIYVDVETVGGQRPVAGVSVDLTVYYNDNAETISLTETDGAGHTQGKLNLPDLRPGQKVRVVVEAATPGGSTIGVTSRSFKSWW